MAGRTVAESAEVWKPHAASDGIYSVSSLGRVRREVRGRTRLAGGVLTPARSANGYDRVCIIYGGRQRCESVHRLVAKAFIPNPRKLPQVNHKNGVKHDNRLANLEWVTAKQNIRHSYDVLGYEALRGEDHYRCRLNSVQARIVIACARIGLPRGWRKDLATFWGIGVCAIGDIARGINWKHLQPIGPRSGRASGGSTS